jgi:hypothetical protein
MVIILGNHRPRQVDEGVKKRVLCIEKGGTVLSREFVTFLLDALMQYITKLEKSQSQKPRSPLLQNINVMYFVDARVQTVKIPPVHKIVLRGLIQNLQTYKVLVNKKIHFHLLISVCS